MFLNIHIITFITLLLTNKINYEKPYETITTVSAIVLGRRSKCPKGVAKDFHLGLGPRVAYPRQQD